MSQLGKVGRFEKLVNDHYIFLKTNDHRKHVPSTKALITQDIAGAAAAAPLLIVLKQVRSNKDA